MSDNIPPPLIVDIISKLPVKSLCRFRCESKPWLALINHPPFSKIHLSRTHKQRLLFQKKKLEKGKGVHALYSLELKTISGLRNSIHVDVEIELPWIKSNWFKVMLVSCNGLVCTEGFDPSTSPSARAVLYNPSTKECKEVATPSFGFLEGVIGFGYAESIDDYKVIEMLESKSIINVYSLRKDSWISIKNNGYLQTYPYNPEDSSSVFKTTCVNGVIIFHDFLGQKPTNIVVLDLVEDKLKTLSPPHDLMLNKDNYAGFHDIGCLNGCLCLSIYADSQSIELWVMKEYSVTESWTKISTVIMSGIIGWLYQFYYLDNNETMLWRYQNDKLMFWDSKDEELKYIKMECIQDDRWCALAVYEESLVSPNRINDFTTEDDGCGRQKWLIDPKVQSPG